MKKEKKKGSDDCADIRWRDRERERDAVLSNQFFVGMFVS